MRDTPKTTVDCKLSKWYLKNPKSGYFTSQPRAQAGSRIWADPVKSWLSASSKEPDSKG